MAKRKEPDSPLQAVPTPSKRVRKSVEASTTEAIDNYTLQSTPQKSKSTKKSRTAEGGSRDIEGSPTPKANGDNKLETPEKVRKSSTKLPSRKTRADQSAKKRSVQVLADIDVDDNDWENATGLATEILADELGDENVAAETIEVDTEAVTPSKRGRGRPKGAKNKRSPTPEGDLPPEERYFFQTRSGPPQVSSNSFSALKLLTHDEYFEYLRKDKDEHETEIAYLLKLHTRSFLQWHFELNEGFSICLYGFGSKRLLLNKFASWLHRRLSPSHVMIMVNGYTPKLNIRSIFNAINSTLPVGFNTKLTGSPRDMLDSLLIRISDSKQQISLFINSIDGPSLRRTPVQTLLASLASHSKINFIATADTPTFQLLWNSNLKDQYKFVYHDATTFAPYEAEINPVDDVNELLGRKGRRVGGKDGIGFVLRSLPENARNLYRVLLTEILAILSDGFDEDNDDEEIFEDNRATAQNETAVGIEYRALYQKASEEFICSSDMNFRFLLKEFHDHQMITSKRDASGTEMLSVPLAKDEMEGVLEDLVVG